MELNLIEEPQNGWLELDGARLGGGGGGGVATHWTLGDVRERRLTYRPNANAALSGAGGGRDKFKMRASLRRVQLDVRVDVRVYGEPYWQPLTVLHSGPLTVEESTSVTLDQSALKILQPGVAPSDIVYVVHQPPQHGYLDVDDDHESVFLFHEIAVIRMTVYY